MKMWRFRIAELVFGKAHPTTSFGGNQRKLGFHREVRNTDVSPPHLKIILGNLLGEGPV
jgi:hypothetical protein